MTPFADRLLEWWEVHGRHDLPWQHPRTPYRVWISEIMLQQTRVETVVGYFQDFMTRFPDLSALATASQDEVLACWSGLGYYSRARNLHRAAGICMERYKGALPSSRLELEALPGIGRTTAAAILAQAHNQPEPILDGNVKRVLARHGAIQGWPGKTSVMTRLWQEAEARMPKRRAADYTQAIMDLGATVCTRTKPHCSRCPVAMDCQARMEDRTGELPARRPSRKIPRRQADFWLILDTEQRLLLKKRPPSGIWGGLWSLPEGEEMAGLGMEPGPILVEIDHAFTHFHLTMTIRSGSLAHPTGVADGTALEWLSVEQARKLGLPQPIRRFLASDFFSGVAPEVRISPASQ